MPGSRRADGQQELTFQQRQLGLLENFKVLRRLLDRVVNDRILFMPNFEQRGGRRGLGEQDQSAIAEARRQSPGPCRARASSGGAGHEEMCWRPCRRGGHFGWTGSGVPVIAKGCRWGAVRLNHEGVAGMMRLADQGVVWLWRVRRIVAMHKNLVCSWLRPGRSRGRKVAVARNRQLDPEPQLMSQLRRGRLKRPKTAIFQNFAGGQRAYPTPARMSFFNACCHFSTTFERSS